MAIGAHHSVMVQRSHADGRSSATEPKFYLPAGPATSFVADRVASVWAALFNHGVETPE
jgi:hypothetical protein